jgi:fumarate hydratase class I
MTAATPADLFPIGADQTPYRKLSSDHVSTVQVEGQQLLKVAPEALTLLANEAMRDIAHLLRPEHLGQLRKILDDPEASSNDRFVALDLLRNANIAAGRVLPSCQDTGTAIVMGKKGQRVWTTGDDTAALTAGIAKAYKESNLRYSQIAPLKMFEEKNTGNNTPAQVDIYSDNAHPDSYEFLFVAKGGGSANKTYLFQETPARLNPAALLAFLDEKIKTLGTSACPPYHLAIVIGGLSAEQTLKTLKLASCHYLDGLPTEGSMAGTAFRDLEMEQQVLKLTQENGIGAQFGGKYFCHDVRVIRLPRHAASLPIGMGVSCSADRQARAKITAEGIFLEQLETDPARFLPDTDLSHLAGEPVAVDLDKPMAEVCALLTKYPVGTRLALTGTLVVARDMAHAAIQRRVDSGQAMPDYMRNHPIYYAGPAKTPQGMVSGSFGPTTAGRMDSYVPTFQAQGASLVTLAKGNRSKGVTDACKQYGGFYLGSIGGPAAIRAQDNIRKVEVLDFADFGMEAVWRIEVVDFPAFIVVDDKGNDFFTATKPVHFKAVERKPG